MNCSKYYQTKQKNAIKDIFMNNPLTRFTAEEIMKKLESSSKKVSKATLYRTLDYLVTSGEVIKDNFDEKYASYQLKSCRCDSSDQVHFRCEKCGLVLHIDNSNMKKVDKQIKEEYGVMINNIKTIIYGTCKKCLGGK